MPVNDENNTVNENVDGAALRLEDLWPITPRNAAQDDPEDEDEDDGPDPEAIIHLAGGAYGILGVTRREVERYPQLRYTNLQLLLELINYCQRRHGGTTMELFRWMWNGHGVDAQLILYSLSFLVTNQLLPQSKAVQWMVEKAQPVMAHLILGDSNIVNARNDLFRAGHLQPDGVVADSVKDLWLYGEVVGPVEDADDEANNGDNGEDNGGVNEGEEVAPADPQ
jgi:hypothetical protein